MLFRHGPGCGIRPPTQEPAGLRALSCASDRREQEAGGLESIVIHGEDESSIKMASETMPERTGAMIDALFNNGAYAVPGAVEDLTRGCPH